MISSVGFSFLSSAPLVLAADSGAGGGLAQFLFLFAPLFLIWFGFGIVTKRSAGPNFCPDVSAQKTNFRSSVAFAVCCGRITYVKVLIG